MAFCEEDIKDNKVNLGVKEILKMIEIFYRTLLEKGSRDFNL